MGRIRLFTATFWIDIFFAYRLLTRYQWMTGCQFDIGNKFVKLVISLETRKNMKVTNVLAYSISLMLRYTANFLWNHTLHCTIISADLFCNMRLFIPCRFVLCTTKRQALFILDAFRSRWLLRHENCHHLIIVSYIFRCYMFEDKSKAQHMP